MKIKDRCKPILYSCILLCYNIIKVVKEIRIMKIYIVRHGQDDDSIRGGWSNCPLIKLGVQQSNQLPNLESRAKVILDWLIEKEYLK